ncbi:hypothetical protein Cfor_00237 [Coptotermes formosanus]|uniref:Uncharacterized protein n=1 Tax=Coptotermes formosanus TaxID=36987 RepID=A0A6L2PIA6_COPFO|nr:hypothetical protein Cfor_00237 [Coptotermes formosanus]
MEMNVEKAKAMGISSQQSRLKIMIGQKQPENMDCHGKSSIQQAGEPINQQTGFNVRKKLVKCYIWSTALCGAETWTLRKVYQKYLRSFEMWCWRRTDKISQTDREEWNILHTVKRRKANWIGHILRRNCLLKHVTEGKIEGRIEVEVRRKRRRKQLLDDRKEMRGYWKMREEALDRILWMSRFGRGYVNVLLKIFYRAASERVDSSNKAYELQSEDIQL